MRRKKNQKFFSNLPSHMIVEILLRLPVKTANLCKCVCKSWLDLISHPEFVNWHLSRSNPCLVVHYTEMFQNFLRLVDFEEHNADLRYDPDQKFDLTALSSFPDAEIVVDGSVHGFLLLHDVNYKHERFYVCNPVTREYIVLPNPTNVVRYPNVVTHGFGVSSQYKVVRIFQERELDYVTGSCLRICRSECQVYTLGTRTWKRVGDAPFAYNSSSIGLFFEGNIHWLVECLEGGPELISCFDLEKEVFVNFPSPFPGGGKRVLGSLEILGGFLCFCDNNMSSFEVDIWVMKEYGVENSWTKEIVIGMMPELLGPAYEVVHALKIYRDGTVLLLWGECFMLFYYGKSKTARQVDLSQTRGPNSIEAMHFVPSFLSLRSFKMEDVHKL